MSNSQDKEFEQFLAGDSPVSELYKKGPDISPAEELDQRILREAHRAVTPHHSYAPFSGRWVVTASFAAVIVLSVSIILQMPYEAEIQSDAVTTLGTRQKNIPASETGDAIELDRFSIEKRQSEFSDEKPLAAPAVNSAPAEAPAPELKRKAAPSRPVATKQASPTLEKSQPAESLPEAAAEPAAREIQLAPRVIEPEASEAKPASAPAAADMGVAKEEQPPALAEPVEESPALMDDIRTEQASPPRMEQDEELSEQAHWLNKIQKMLDENHTEQARSEYAAFRKKYPDFHSHMTVEIEEKLGTR